MAQILRLCRRPRGNQNRTAGGVRRLGTAAHPRSQSGQSVVRSAAWGGKFRAPQLGKSHLAFRVIRGEFRNLTWTGTTPFKRRRFSAWENAGTATCGKAASFDEI